MKARAARVFLTAEWRNLAMLNYEIAPAVLRPLLPRGTELDSWQGRNYVSIVGFQFRETRVWGVPIPFHRHFEELNLRFYVRRRTEEGWRRGVVFIKEIVPRAAIALVARVVYNEPYVALPMSHRVEATGSVVKLARYAWRFGGREHYVQVVLRGEAQDLAAGSEAEFITEHYWGFNKHRHDRTLEYQVEHPRWRVYAAAEAALDCDVAGLYGLQFTAALTAAPVSAFLAEGSPIRVYQGTTVTP